MSDIIQFRRGTAAGATSSNPTLNQGEPGYETDTGKLKIGDGSTAWTSLEYFKADEAWTLTMVTNAEAGAPTGATNEMVVCNCADGNVTVNLPESATCLYKKISVCKYDDSVNTVTINAYAGDIFINGDETLVIQYQYTTVTLMSAEGVWILT